MGLSGEAWDAHCELAVLRLLVEALLMRLDADECNDVLSVFRQSCEQMRSDMLNSTLAEPSLAGMERAIRLQKMRLHAAGLLPPTQVED